MQGAGQDSDGSAQHAGSNLVLERLAPLQRLLLPLRKNCALSSKPPSTDQTTGELARTKKAESFACHQHALHCLPNGLRFPC